MAQDKTCPKWASGFVIVKKGNIMNLKVKAALQTAVFLVSMTVAAYILSQVALTITREQFYWALGVSAVAFFAYMIYSINLGRLEYRERLAEIANRNLNEIKG